jgi:hypothetical protein
MNNTEKIEKLRKELEDVTNRINSEIEELEKQNRHWYIIKVTMGDWNYYDEYFNLAGFTSEANIKKYIEATKDDNSCFEDEYFEVDESTYEMYEELLRIKDMINDYSRSTSRLMLYMPEIEKEVITNKAKMEQIYEEQMKKVGFRFPSFQHIGRKINVVPELIKFKK